MCVCVCVSCNTISAALIAIDPSKLNGSADALCAGIDALLYSFPPHEPMYGMLQTLLDDKSGFTQTYSDVQRNSASRLAARGVDALDAAVDGTGECLDVRRLLLPAVAVVCLGGG